MMQMISGTIKNAVKLDMLAQNWEQKKNSNQILTRQERNARANMSSEEKMLEQFKKEMEQNREQSRNNDIANKIMNGEELSPEEERYLSQKNPGQLSNYRRMKEERKAYEEKLKACKTKDEVQRLKTNTMNAYLAELKSARGSAKVDKAMEIIGKVRNILKAELHFIKSGEYSKLPTEADEAVERAEERSEENERILEEMKESVSQEEEEPGKENLVETEPSKKEESLGEADILQGKGQTKVEDFAIRDDKKKELKAKKQKKDPLEEIEEICRNYIPNLGGEWKGLSKASRTETGAVKPNQTKTGSKVDISI